MRFMSTYVVGYFEASFVFRRHSVVGHCHDDDVEDDTRSDDELENDVGHDPTQIKTSVIRGTL